MTAQEININEQRLISDIDLLSQIILNKLANDNLDDINLFLEQRFDLISELLQYAENNQQIQRYLQLTLQTDQSLIEFIHNEKDQIHNIIRNMNQLSDYLA